MTTIIAFVQFKGFPIQCMMKNEELLKQRDEVIRNYMNEGYTLPQIKEEIYTQTLKLYNDLYDKFNKVSYSLRDIVNFWKGDALCNSNYWTTGIMILIKLKAIKQDEENGWLVVSSDSPIIDKTKPTGKRFKASSFKACATCGILGKPDKCSGCNKVHYCSAECQKEDWKAHKPNCHK